MSEYGKWYASRYPFSELRLLNLAPHGRDMKKDLTRIDIRLEHEEKTQIKNRAKACGLTVSEFIRRCSLNDNPKFLSCQEREEMIQLRKEIFTLIRIGNLYHEQKTKEFKAVIEKGKRFLAKLKNRL